MIPGLPNDTHPKIEALLIEGYRKMSPSQKLERVGALTRAVQELALMDIWRRHPDAAPREQALRVASRWLDPEPPMLSRTSSSFPGRPSPTATEHGGGRTPRNRA